MNSTQNLLNKTENLVATAAGKTKEITQQIREVPGRVVEKTNTVIQKGVNLGEKVKDRAETLTDKGIDFGKRADALTAAYCSSSPYQEQIVMRPVRLKTSKAAA